MITLIINGVRADVKKGAYNYKLQVNNLFEFDTREHAVSETMYLPQTPTNKQIFGFSEQISSINNKERKAFRVQFLIGGVSILNDGIGFLQGVRASDYIFAIYDNSRSLYTKIGDRSINDLNLWEIDFKRDLTELIKRLKEQSEVIYTLDSYGVEPQRGILGIGAMRCNADYLLPSIQMDWMRLQVEKIIGFKLLGSFFNEPFWKNLYLTTSEGKTKKIDDLYNFFHKENINLFVLYFHIKRRKFNIPRGYYDNKIKPIRPIFTASEENTYILYFKDIEVSEKDKKIEQVYIYTQREGVGEVALGSFSTERSHATIIASLRVGEQVFVGFKPTEAGLKMSIKLNLQVAFYNTENTNIQQYLSEFKLLDFLKEVLTLFGLTPIRTSEGVIEFFTFNEILEAPSIHWSGKIAEVTEIKFRHTGSYGQINRFEYAKYDPEKNHQNYADFTVLYPDEALPLVAVHKSKFYAPLNNNGVLSFEFWEKEFKKKEQGVEVIYREKQNRFHLFECVKERLNDPVAMSFDSDTQNITLRKGTLVNKASFTNLTREKLNEKYYKGYHNIMSSLCLVEAKIHLTQADIVAFNFKNPVYFSELGAIFWVNEINFNTQGLSTIKMLRIPQRD